MKKILLIICTSFFVHPAYALTINGIDTSLPFSAKEMSDVAVKMTANEAEIVTLNKVLQDQKPGYRDIPAFRSLRDKTLATATQKEKSQIMAGYFRANEWIKYYSRKQILK